MKKLTSMLLALAFVLSLAACGGAASSSVASSAASSEAVPEAASEAASSEEAKELSTTDALRIAGLKGPTTMGLVNLLSMEEDGTASMDYDLQLYGAADEIVPLLMKGELDMAAIPANLAATLYQKTEGGIQAVAVNTLGVLYVVENGNSVQSIADLAGRKILAAGQGSTPEYILNYILDKNGLTGSVEVEYAAEHAEAVTKLASGEADIIVVPEPFVTTALSKAEGARIALDLTAEWESVSDAQLVQGCLVVRKAFADEHPEALKAFLKEYASSAEYAVSSPADAGTLVEKYGIMASAALAEKAIPNCNIVCITGEEMQVMVSGMLKVLFDANPKSVGGKLPGDNMFYLG